MQKGLTPVVAIILLISVSVAAVGTVYTLVQQNIETGKEIADPSRINLNQNTVTKEQCFLENGETHIKLRNQLDQAVNSSEFGIILDTRVIDDFESSPIVVDPQETFTVDLNQKVGRDERIRISNGQNDIGFVCQNIPSGKGLRLLSIGASARQSEGGSAPVPPDGGTDEYGGIYSSYNDSVIESSSGGSYTMAVFNRDTRNFDTPETYDVYNDHTNFEDAIDDVFSNPADDENLVVIIVSSNEPQNNRLSPDLENKMYNLGASESLFGSSDFRNQSAYVLVGSPALSKGEAYLERYQGQVDNSANAWIDVDYTIEDD